MPLHLSSLPPAAASAAVPGLKTEMHALLRMPTPHRRSSVTALISTTSMPTLRTKLRDACTCCCTTHLPCLCHVRTCCTRLHCLSCTASAQLPTSLPFQHLSHLQHIAFGAAADAAHLHASRYFLTAVALANSLPAHSLRGLLTRIARQHCIDVLHC